MPADAESSAPVLPVPQTPPMPWVARQRESLAAKPGHAWLLQGAAGLGQYELAIELAASWLCEAPGTKPCGQCPSCHGIAVRTHADLCVLMPEVTLIERGWPLDEKAQKDIDEKDRKPSREIRVEAVREALEFAQRTSGRGQGKVIVVYPAERLNTVSANALLKTLEEPPGGAQGTRFILASEAAHLLLPTLRSRCLTHTMAWPDASEALAWLGAHGMPAAEAATLLRAAGGRPQAALDLAAMGCNAQAWKRLPQALARGEVAALGGWPAARALDAMQKLCHDLMARQAGAPPRFFEAADLPPLSQRAPLSAWSAELQAAARAVEHPVQAGLQLEAWVSRARRVLRPPTRTGAV
ncbi:MAG: DNA polymerase III subunit delta' [Burkholderiaceae bacterium]